MIFKVALSYNIRGVQINLFRWFANDNKNGLIEVRCFTSPHSNSVITPLYLKAELATQPILV